MARGRGRLVSDVVTSLVAALGYMARLCADSVSAVRAAASLLVVAAFVQACVAAPMRPEENARAASAETPAERDDVPRQQPETPQTVDLGAAAARFGSARQGLGPGEWAAFSEVHVLDRGARGTWDDYGVGSPIVMADAGAAGRAARYRMWYVGCHLALREHSCAVGHATSPDGVVWDKRPQPVFMPADPVAQDNLTEIAVVTTGAGYFLWYSVAADYPAGRRRATVNMATSPDGLVWTDQGQVLEGVSPRSMSIEHGVVHDGQRFHMWYVDAVEELDAPELRHLSSSDGKAWVAVGGTPLKNLRQDMEDLGRLTVETTDGQGFRAWFTLPASDQKHQSKALGALVSADGTTWHTQPIGADPFTAMMERTGSLRLSAAAGVNAPLGLWLWVTLVDAYPHDRCIGVAFRNGPPR